MNKFVFWGQEPPAEIKQERALVKPLIYRRNAVKNAASIYTLFAWFDSYHELQELLSPYSDARFSSQWGGKIANVDRAILQITQSSKPVRFGRADDFMLLFNKRYRRFAPDSGLYYMAFLSDDIVRKLEGFLQKYKEGALVVLALLKAARRGTVGLYSPDGSKKHTMFDATVAATAKKIGTQTLFSFDGRYRRQGLILVDKL